MKKICIKWQKELFKDIEVDTEQPPLLLKSQLFTLTGVPPDRQKIMVPKAGLLKDDDWGKAELKDGMSLMMMGTAEKIPEPPPEEPKFIEDLPEDQQNAHELSRYGAGLVNLGNTCYMNSVLQCMYAVPELRQSLLQYGNRSSDPHVSAGTESRARLSAEAGRLFHQMNESGQPVPPVIFLALMKQIYPQFAQTGPKGAPKQQDAEECWTELMYTFRELVKDGSESIVAKLFAADTITKYKCEESGEEDEEREKLYSLKCNITSEVNHLHEGLALGLKADREKTSPALGRVVVFAGSAQLSSLPPYLCIHKVRFFYKQDVQQKAKILRKVSFPATLDLFDFCTEELRQELRGPRLALKALEDKDLGLGKAGQGGGAAAGKEDKDAAEAGASTDPVEAQAAADPYAYAGKMTGRYTLLAVLTHKGRSADSGHYVGWVKQDDNKWVQFDDDEMLERKEEDILALSGGGDWHMAYILLYKCQRVAQKPAAAMDAEPAAEPTPMET